MKKIISSIIFLVVLFNQPLFSQSYFGSVTDVPVNYGPNMSSGSVYFGLEKVSTAGYLDIVVTRWEDGERFGQWNLNNGNGSFGSINNFSAYMNDFGEFEGNFFVKLRPNSQVKDLVIVRYDGWQVHWNNSGITDIQQYLDVGNPLLKMFSAIGYIDATDKEEDLIIADGTNIIKVYKNQISTNPGTLALTPISINLPSNNSVYQFKIRQLDQKSHGYIQGNLNDRSDIVFIDDPTTHPNKIYARVNTNTDGFSTTNFFLNPSNQTSIEHISDFEVADIDNDGYNDIIVTGSAPGCGYPLQAEVYRNAQGQLIGGTPIWSFTSAELIRCGSYPKLTIADINKDGLNDLVFLTNKFVIESAEEPVLEIRVFINQNTSPPFTNTPQEFFEIPGTAAAEPTGIMAADIYGGEQIDGGGIALIISYNVVVSGERQHHVKVLNARNEIRATNPPPPIVQGFLEYDPSISKWRPHLHLDYRGERDFFRYEIYKYKTGWSLPQFQGYTQDTGWTDFSECVALSGGDVPDWNCYYYAIAVDDANKNSIPSQNAYYTVGCIPVCPVCGGDNPINNQNQNNTAEKFSVFNYPNPFNPTTNIQFTIPKADHVKIVIYNSIGQVVKEIVNGYYEAGTYKVTFDGSKIASGIYFYTTETGSYSQTSKMLLLK